MNQAPPELISSLFKDSILPNETLKKKSISNYGPKAKHASENKT